MKLIKQGKEEKRTYKWCQATQPMTPHSLVCLPFTTVPHYPNPPLIPWKIFWQIQLLTKVYKKSGMKERRYENMHCDQYTKWKHNMPSSVVIWLGWGHWNHHHTHPHCIHYTNHPHTQMTRDTPTLLAQDTDHAIVKPRSHSVPFSPLSFTGTE